MHGKTTTTSMVAAVLAAGNLDPTVVVGGRVDALGSNARLGKSQYLIAEADESDRSFLKLSPILSVVTNIDREHMDTYRDMQDVEDTFIQFMDRVPFYGMLVVCNDDDPLRALFPKLQRRYVTYGIREESDFRVTDAVTELPQGARKPLSRFAIEYNGKSLGEFCLHVPGAHNVLNATAAIAVGVGLDIPVYSIQYALETFRGVDRRFQLKGEVDGVRIVDDYGHHPTEVRATLQAAKQCCEGKVHVIFQPHRYTRTQALMSEFSTSFADADNLFVLDIYPASEQPIPGITAEALTENIAATGRPAMYVSSTADAIVAATSVAKPGDIILTLGAGSIYQLGPQIVEALKSKLAGTAL
jgi:UDP-N-acetylmuramate--alanine ligase